MGNPEWQMLLLQLRDESCGKKKVWKWRLLEDGFRKAWRCILSLSLIIMKCNKDDMSLFQNLGLQVLLLVLWLYRITLCLVTKQNIKIQFCGYWFLWVVCTFVVVHIKQTKTNKRTWPRAATTTHSQNFQFVWESDRVLQRRYNQLGEAKNAPSREREYLQDFQSSM